MPRATLSESCAIVAMRTRTPDARLTCLECLAALCKSCTAMLCASARLRRCLACMRFWLVAALCGICNQTPPTTTTMMCTCVPQTLDLLESWAVGKLGAHSVARVDQHTRSAACHAVVQVGGDGLLDYGAPHVCALCTLDRRSACVLALTCTCWLVIAGALVCLHACAERLCACMHALSACLCQRGTGRLGVPFAFVWV